MMRMVNRIVEYISMLFMVAMVLVVLLQIVLRTFFGTAFLWAEEVARFMMIWVIFLGTAIAFRYGAHISIEFLFNRLPEPLRKAGHAVIALLILVFVVVLIATSWELCQKSMINFSPALEIPMGYVYAVIPVSGVLMILNLIHAVVCYFRTGRVAEEEQD